MPRRCTHANWHDLYWRQCLVCTCIGSVLKWLPVTATMGNSIREATKGGFFLCMFYVLNNTDQTDAGDINQDILIEHP